MVINTNIAATAAIRTLGESAKALSASLTRLSSGSKIVSPEDDAAGLAQSIKFDSQINRNHAVRSNITNAISFSQTQDGFLQKVQSALDRMSEISVLAQDVTKTDNDRESYNAEYQQLINSINDIASKEFNGVSLFQNSPSRYDVIDPGDMTWQQAKVDAENRGGHLAVITSEEEKKSIMSVLGDDYYKNLWIGATDENSEGDWEWVTGEDWNYENWRYNQPDNNSGDEHYAHYWGSRIIYDTETLGRTEIGVWNDETNSQIYGINGKYIIEYETNLDVTIDHKGNKFTLESIHTAIGEGSIATASDANTALSNIKKSINVLAESRAKIGSNITRLKSTAGSLSNLNENLSAANSRIKDVDVAEESTRFARSSILVQSGTAMLSQANILPEMVLKLVG